ncbi:unnamed protein product [Sphenostylis stenocarpa]|uniref:Uncharacterized protein n=1 Tax=Sphenostylis stenocarpa TaxID=92480 RepID=A0AA86VQW5_9FABA|nr:unnamed protein product [Sphenostylis stenocarpa]
MERCDWLLPASMNKGRSGRGVSETADKLGKHFLLAYGLVEVSAKSYKGSLFNAFGNFQVRGLPEMYFIEENDEKEIKKISGRDENEQK